MAEKARQLLAKVRALGLDRAMALLLVALSFLLVIQGVRFVFAVFSARGLVARVHAGAEAPERTDRKPATDYDAILEKGLLGKKEKGGPAGPAPSVNVFGILGDKALLGASANDAKPFAVGAEAPGGEKLVQIGTAEVVLEKDGNKRTLKVFPALSPPKGPGASGAPGAPGSPTAPGAPGTPTAPGASAPGVAAINAAPATAAPSAAAPAVSAPVVTPAPAPPANATPPAIAPSVVAAPAVAPG